MAEPGQILVSSTLRDLGLGKGARFERIGERTLKDVDEAVLLYAVPWERPKSDRVTGVRALVQGGARLWNELRRRRVVKVLIGYVIVLIGVLQAAELTLEPLGLPGWSYELVLLLGVLGLPVALVMAWAFDVTPRGLERTAPPVD
jgi:class 3 adenylate cyclase